MIADYMILAVDGRFFEERCQNGLHPPPSTYFVLFWVYWHIGDYGKRLIIRYLKIFFLIFCALRGFGLLLCFGTEGTRIYELAHI